MQSPPSHPLDIDILPERYRPRRITAPMVAAVVVAAALLLGLTPAYTSLLAAQTRAAALQTRLNQVKAALAQVQSKQAQLVEQMAEIEQQIERERAQVARLRIEFSTLRQQRVPRSAGIAAVIAALVPRVHIATMIQEDGSFILTGQAGSQGLVLDYARALQASGVFANVRILSMSNADPLGLVPEIEFSIEMEQ